MHVWIGGKVLEGSCLLIVQHLLTNSRAFRPITLAPSITPVHLYYKHKQRTIPHQATTTAKMQYKSLAVFALSAGALAAPEKRQATDASL
jgi:hypothetical protein